MQKKYFNDAFIGNQNVTVSFTKYGELLRLYYPLPDYRQYSDFLHVGIKVNDSNIIYLHSDVNNKYNQYYTENTNILNTEITNSYFNLDVHQIDAVMIDKDVIIKKYVFTNNNSIDLNINFLVHSKTLSSYNNQAGSYITEEALIQYSHNFTCAIFANQKTLSHQVNDVERNIGSGVIYDKDYISQASEAAISYDLGVLHPGESREFVVYMYLSYENTNLNEIRNNIDKFKKTNVEKELAKIEKYWIDFLNAHNRLKIKSDGTELMDQMMKIYNRSILYMPLLVNEETGGISASLEVDEERDKSGRYSFCWPRDNVMVYMALDFLGFDDYGDKFYKIFLKNTQDKTGMWEQRFYTDGRLAPCWGYQIDETAEVVWGAYMHYQIAKKYFNDDKEDLLIEILPMLEKAIDFLEKYINYILNEEDKNVEIDKQYEEKYYQVDKDEIYKHPSYDLWEMNEGIHLYSLSAIYAAFGAMHQIYNAVGQSFKYDQKKMDEIAEEQPKYLVYRKKIKEYILENLYDKQRKVLKRNTTDNLTDISEIGAIIPYHVFNANDEVMKNTIDEINLTLRTYNSGYLRFQNDTYIGGTNPWIISTAMMGMYYTELGDRENATACMKYIVDNATPLSLLPEQSNKDLNKTWVIGLGWSHAKFLNFFLEYIGITNISLYKQ